MRLKQTLAALTLATVAAGGGALFAAPPIPRGDNCSGSILTHHTLVYFGATAPNPAIALAARTLYGNPTFTGGTCTQNQETFNADVDFDNNGTYDACVTLYVGTRSGSCEGVHALDAGLNNFNVCSVGNAPVALSTIPGGLVANVVASDVSATNLCAQLPGVGPLANPSFFTGAAENRVFVIPFGLIVNKDFRSLLPASKIIAPGGACPGGLADCPRIDISLNKAQLQGIFGNSDQCDWRNLDSSIGSGGFGTPIVAPVMRNYLSGTRNLFNALVLFPLAAGQGSIFVPGTGDVINRVNGNLWCGTNPSECGEFPPNPPGGGSSICTSIPAPNHAISIGYVGTDRFNIVDNGTPANPFDDYGARKGTENYDVLSYNGHQFNESNVQCGYYDYWSYERMYFNPNIHTVGLKRSLVMQFINGVATESNSDPTVVQLSSMQVSRANDGSPQFALGAYNPAICAAP